MTQRAVAIRSRKLLDSAKGQECTFHFPGTCNHDRETTISAHLSDDTRGAARKADDFASVHSCSSCHDFFDRRLWLGTDIEPDIHWYALRAFIRTLRNRIERGLIFIPLDAPKSFDAKPVKARKPKSERTPVAPSRPLQSRGFEPGHRPIVSRNTLRKART